MGGRGAFINVDMNEFTFIENGQIYHTIGFEDNVKYIIQDDHKGGKKIPDYSHSDNGIYVLIAKGKIKQIGIYEDHRKIKSIDLLHTHKNKITGEILNWHYHDDLNHIEEPHKLSEDDIKLVYKIFKKGNKYL